MNNINLSLLEPLILSDYYLVPKEKVLALQNIVPLIFADIITQCKGVTSSEKKIEYDKIERNISYEIRFLVLKRQKWRCNLCNESLKFNKNSKFGNEVAHIDHIHPFSLRESYIHGSENINELSNLQALCPKCNLKLSNIKIK